MNSFRWLVLNLDYSIVAVHGLGGDPQKTWTAKDKKTSWLQDPMMLPQALPQARVLTWGYDADVFDVMGGTSSDRVLQHAQTLISQLHADRSVGIFFTSARNSRRLEADCSFRSRGP